MEGIILHVLKARQSEMSKTEASRSALFSDFCCVSFSIAEKHIFTFPFNIFLIWRGGGAISLMESDRILLCLMKFRLKNETQTLRTVIAKTTPTIVLLFWTRRTPKDPSFQNTIYNTGEH